MKEIVPDYYPKFRCIADRCRHSCCIGWEIDIDEDTLQIYDTPSVPLYDKFRKQIDRTGTPHFCLDADERCPFLTASGLCEIILTMGEENLCQICADHPRFRNFFSDRTETGLGLCCEAAAEIILFREEPTDWLILEDDGEEEIVTPEEEAFYRKRKQMYALLQDRTIPMGTRLRRVLALSETEFHKKPISEWVALYRTLEQLDSAWDELLQKLSRENEPLTLPETETPWEIPLENLAVYFVFRHLADALDDDRFAERIGFCVLSVSLLYTFWNRLQLSADELPETVRLYSSEIEYSEENMETLLSALSEI